MSDLSPLYSEYEKVSGLFRSLNEASLMARQSRLGISSPTEKEAAATADQLGSALAELGSENELNAPVLSDLFDELSKEDVEISPRKLLAIRSRVGHGLDALTEEDLEVIEKVTEVLDAESEVLFRRIQK